MSEDNLEDFLVLRDLDEPITREQLNDAADQSGNVLRALRDEGVGIEWVDSEVLSTENGEVIGTFCHYRAEDETAIREHAERAGLPATRVERRGDPLAGE
jgi:hypothetical protein